MRNVTPMEPPKLKLSTGIEIPQLGFGVSFVLPEDTQELVELALETGYAHIDVVAANDNEAGVGAALANSGLSREDYFVTARLCDPEARGATLAAFETSLARLRLDHVDLYLLDRSALSEEGIVDTWRAFEEIHREEAARAIGVAGFGIEDLALLEREAGTQPTVNQVELHPWLQQAELRAWHAKHGIATKAWSPLAQGALLDERTIARIADAHGKTPVQAILRWHAQLGNVAIPRLVTRERIREAIDSYDFELSGAEMAAIGGLERGRRIGPGQPKFVGP